MKLILFTLFPIFTLFFSKTINANNCFDYPQKITELNSSDIYDSARWVLFNWLGSKKLDEVYYGQMELKYENVHVNNDTMIIFFNFYATDSISENKNKLTRVANASVTIKQSTKKCIWAFNYPFEDFSSHLSTGDKRLESSPSTTTINFLKSENKINDCFLELARRKELLE